MANVKEKCVVCENEFSYDETEDTKNNPLIPIKVFKVIVFKGNVQDRFYNLPKDKQKLVGKDFIKLMCNDCYERSITPVIEKRNSI